MRRRLAQYRTWNNSVVAEPSVSQLFAENGTEVYEEHASTSREKAISGFKVYIERFEVPNNYMDDLKKQANREFMDKVRSDKEKREKLEEEKAIRERMLEKELRR
mmetsp:Transcript_5233/g.3956  ORF Transcript_5233/g.3956 Transcript_5233/m.3956 type:complete len:105 (+) Transcript_5233:1849-2163(+)